MRSSPIARHPVVACWGGVDSAPAAGLGAAFSLALDVPRALVVAGEQAPVASSALVLPAAEVEARCEAARTGVPRARGLVPRTVDGRERLLPAERIAPSLCDAVRETDVCLLVVGRDVDRRVARGVVRRGPCPVLVLGRGMSASDAAPLGRSIAARR